MSAARTEPRSPPQSGRDAERERVRSAPRTLAVIAAVLRKELRVELRTLESVPGMVLFSISTFVVFHFALNRASADGDLAAGLLTASLLFSAMLAVNRLWVADAEQGGFDAFLLAPADRSALLVAKALTLLIYLLALEVVAVPAFGLLLLSAPLGRALPWIALVLLLADLGLAVIGTLVSALAVRTRARDLLGPLLALPLLVPVVLGAARALAPVLLSGPAGAPAARWLALLGLYDLVFALLAYAVFDFLLED